MPFLIIRNDIVKVQADAIVNPANEDLLEGSGTSKAIYEAAGVQQLQEACEKIGWCSVGDAVLTKAFGLNAKYIIHAVGPVWYDGNHHEKELLAQTYSNALQLAAQYGCESIAFPLLSSGNYGYPKDQAMRVAMEAVSDFLMAQDMLVYMVLYDRDSLLVSQRLFASIEEYIDDHYVAEHDEFLEGDEWYPELLNISRSSIGKLCESEERLSEPLDRIEEASGNYCLGKSAVPSGKRSLDSLVMHLDETFSEMLLRLIDERGLKDSTVYKKANIDRRHFSKIKNDKDYAPTKKTVVAFAIALQLSMDETVDLMKRAGFAFSNASKFDVIISFFIENENYNIFEINEVLFAYDQPILGE